MKKIGSNPFANESNGTSGIAHLCLGVKQISEEKCAKIIRKITELFWLAHRRLWPT
jgi:hypothetical protein